MNRAVYVIAPNSFVFSVLSTYSKGSSRPRVGSRVFASEIKSDLTTCRENLEQETWKHSAGDDLEKGNGNAPVFSVVVSKLETFSS